MNFSLILASFLKKNKYKPVLVSFLLMSGLSLFSLLIRRYDLLLYQLVFSLFYAIIGCLIFYTGKINLFRKILIIVLTVFFLILLTAKHFHPAASCPIALSTVLPSSLHNFKFKFFIPVILWFGFIVLIIGRMWCSWSCWFSGIDECFSSLSKKAYIFPNKWLAYFSELPSAILLFCILAALSTGTAVFCLWICPFKMTSSFLDNTFIIKTIQTIIFILIGTFFLILIPLLSKKRSFCRFICPLRGLLKWCSYFHPSKITINLNKCTKCGLCAQKCKSLAIDEQYNISPYCNFCLECVEACPENAVTLSPGTPAFIFIALLLSGMAGILFLSFVC